MVFYESIRLKILYTTILIALTSIVYYALHQYDNFDVWLGTWQVKTAGILGSLMMIYIWLEGSVVFDEMMQVVTIKSWFSKILPAKQIHYPEIKAVVLKRFGYIDEDGHETNEGYFHLQLNNGKTVLVMVFKHKDSIENARKRLIKHTKLHVQAD